MKILGKHKKSHKYYNFAHFNQNIFLFNSLINVLRALNNICKQNNANANQCCEKLKREFFYWNA